MKNSKNTVALWAQYPNLRAWVLGNLTLPQLEAVCQAPRDCVSFGGQHPLSNERLAAGVFRAYRQDAVWCIKSRFKSLAEFDDMQGQGETWDELYHHALVTAIACMVDEHPEVLAQAEPGP